MMVNIAVFASHGGSDLQAIIDGCNNGGLDAKVCAVISNNSGSIALERARTHKIPAYHVSSKTHPDPAQLDKTILDILCKHETHMIFLAGYMRRLGQMVLQAYESRVFNIHPALLPKHGGQGMFGINVHKAVLEAGEEETGVTIHYVNAEYDSGDIVAQTTVPVLTGDTPETLAARVLEREHSFLVEVIEGIIKNGWERP